MKIMLYSQHVLGIGHFFRSMAIARALDRHEVLFVEGGEPLSGFVPPRHVRRVFLPSLMMDPEFKKIETRRGSPDEIKLERKQLLWETFQSFLPDVLVTELFPFGRKQFRFELTPVLEAVKERGLKTRVVCSLRDILVEKNDQAAYEEGVLKILNRYYDLLLIHADPRLVSLRETFESVGEIRIPVHYTGFVVREAPLHQSSNGEKIIVASSGGGKVGAELLSTAIKAIRAIEDETLRLRTFLGPFMEGADREHLEKLIGGDLRISLHPFSLDFLGELARADLSISMAGYNTCMDILSAGVRALVHPFPQNREQGLRAAKLEKLGLLDIIRDLDAGALACAIEKSLAKPAVSAEQPIDLSGAENTARLVEKYFAKA